MKMRREEGGEIDLPLLDVELIGLASYLFDVGPTGSNGQMLTWSELEAWQRATGLVFPPWQLRLFRFLSAEYAAEAIAATSHDAPPPWEFTVDRERVAKQIKRLLRGK